MRKDTKDHDCQEYLENEIAKVDLELNQHEQELSGQRDENKQLEEKIENLLIDISNQEKDKTAIYTEL